VALDQPPDPVAAGDPVVIPRRRPGTVTLAGVMLFASAVVGALAGLAVLATSDGVVADFHAQAMAAGVPADQAADVAATLRSALVTSSMAALALAGLSLVVGWGVLRRSELARLAALGLAAASLACSVVRTGVTSLGGSVDWSVAAGRADPAMTQPVAQAFDTAMPAWLVGLTAGLTDLQSLGAALVVGLLLAPASVVYFRRRLA
jgi:hypothetical protein